MSKPSTRSQRAMTNVTLLLECDEDELSDIQKKFLGAADKEYAEAMEKISNMMKTHKVIHKGKEVMVLQNGTFEPSTSTSVAANTPPPALVAKTTLAAKAAAASVVRATANQGARLAPTTYQLVVNPNLGNNVGFLVGSVPSSSQSSVVLEIMENYAVHIQDNQLHDDDDVMVDAEDRCPFIEYNMDDGCNYNCIDISSGSNNEEQGTTSSAKSRPKRIAKATLDNQNSRRQGKEYVGRKYTKVDGKYKSVAQEKTAVTMGPHCGGCIRIMGKRNCSKFTQSDRDAIFKLFWSLDRKDKISFVKKYVELSPPKRRRTEKGNNARIQFERRYYLDKDGTRLQVCAQLFANTLAISARTIHFWSGETNRTPDSVKRKVVAEELKASQAHLLAFLSSLACIPSHCCQGSTDKKYLEPPFTSKQQVFRAYKEQAAAKKMKPFSWSALTRAMTKQKLCIYHPRKVQCEVCGLFQLKKIPKFIYNDHIKRKAESTSSMESALKDADALVVCVDAEFVLMCPHCLNKALYFRTKLNVYNYTFFNLKTKKVFCYLWSEIDGGLESSVFATMMTDYLEMCLKENPNTKVIKIYSDGFRYQNRCIVLSNAILEFSYKHSVTVEQCFLEQGHTLGEVNAAFAAIEHKLKSANVYIPTHYEKIITAARSEDPYRVKSVNYEFFKDFTGVLYYSSIKPGVKEVVDLRCLKYNPDATINYKIFYTDNWEVMPHKTENMDFKIPRLNEHPQCISAQKFKQLQELKTIIPKEHWAFYDNLPHIVTNFVS